MHSCIPLLRPWLSYLHASVSFFILNQTSDRSLSLSPLSFVFLPIHQTVSSSPTQYHTSSLPPSSAPFTSLSFPVSASLCCSPILPLLSFDPPLPLFPTCYLSVSPLVFSSAQICFSSPLLLLFFMGFPSKSPFPQDSPTFSPGQSIVPRLSVLN